MSHSTLTSILTFLILTLTFLKCLPLTFGKEVIVDLEAHYFQAAPDGVSKQVLGVNGQFPAPTIRAKLHDTLVIRVKNSIKDNDGLTHPTSIHWHGIEMLLTPWYDGPEGVTQCPIPYGQSMEYRFKLNQAGTYWYHSHHSWQYVEGFWGLMIIDNDPGEVYHYDDELQISLMDWHHTPAKILSQQYHSMTIPGPPDPDSGLINGRGTYPCRLSPPGMPCDPTNQCPSVINVMPGNTYRIRVINTAARAAFNFSIDGHKLTAIEVDGVDTVAVGPVDSVVVWPAQRYSFLVTMNGNLNRYWIRANMNTPLNPDDQPKAILQYNREICQDHASFASDHPFTDAGVHVQAQGRPEKHDIDWAQLMSEAKKTKMAPMIDPRNISEYVYQASPRLITVQGIQRRMLDEKLSRAQACATLPTTLPTTNPVFLDPMRCRPISRGYASAPPRYDELFVLNATFDTSGPKLKGKINGIAYGVDNIPVIVRMKNKLPILPISVPQHTPRLKRVIQIVINNQNGGSHPWHLHGHTFWVLGTGPGNYTESRDAVKLNINGVRRDTTETLGNSWLVVRYETDNPGAWLLHCHINWHLEIGLGAVFIELAEELRTLLSVPEETRRVCRLNNVMINAQ